MVRGGETGGALSVVLDRVASYMEKTLRLKRKVKSALIYPIVVVSMAILITIVLLVKVVPTFTEIYASFDQDLPAGTELVAGGSEGSPGLRADLPGRDRPRLEVLLLLLRDQIQAELLEGVGQLALRRRALRLVALGDRIECL